MVTDNFVIEGRLGVGATAEVLRARHKSSGKLRALKVFSPLVLSDPETARRVRQEAEVLISLHHPNIVQLESVLAADEQLALELEFVDGKDLRAWRNDYTIKLLEPLLWVLGQMARGLGAAHEKGILHRDLKPENVLIARTGEVKLTDFGLARQLDMVTITKTGLLAGSIGYMAPELIDGGKPSMLSDVFSFGVVAFELITEKNPFSANNPQAVLKKIGSGLHVPIAELQSALPQPIARLIESCLSPNPENRPKSIWHVEAELNNFLAASKLNKLCKSIAATDSRAQVLSLAFGEKHKQLLSTWQILQTSQTNNAEIIQLASEWSFCFPDAPEPLELLQSAHKGGESRRRPVAAIVLLVLAISGLVYVLAQKKTLVVTPTETPAIALALPVPATTEPEGWVSIEADPDVSVAIDGRKIPKKLLKRMAVKAGARHIELTKVGFLPITNIINVKAGDTSIINARTNQP